MKGPGNIQQSSPGTPWQQCGWLQCHVFLYRISLRGSRLSTAPLAMQAHSYAEAWELATANRVDLNIMVDLGWPDFVERAGEFVHDVQVRC